MAGKPIDVEVLPFEDSPKLVLEALSLSRDKLKVFVRPIAFHITVGVV